MVAMKELEELTREIREKLPRLIRNKDGKRKVIPMDPMLNDVIDWIKQTSDPYKIDLRIHLLLLSWDLSNPYLKDQSPELISFLHSLIKTKQ